MGNGASVALLVVFTGFTGTVLLFEQNKRLVEQTNQLILQNKSITEQTQQFIGQNKLLGNQNALIGLSLVTQFRERLKSTGSKRFEMEAEFGGLTKFQVSESCGVEIKSRKESDSQPNNSEILALSKLVDTKGIGHQVKEALEFLLKDDNSAVALGAALALSRARHLPAKTSLTLNNLTIDSVTLNAPIQLNLSNSAATNFKCTKCEITISNSLVQKSEFKQITFAFNTFFFHSTSWIDRVMLSLQDPTDRNKVLNSQNSIFPDNGPFSLEEGVEASGWGSFSHRENFFHDDAGNLNEISLKSAGKSGFNSRNKTTKSKLCEKLKAICARNNFMRCTDHS